MYQNPENPDEIILEAGELKPISAEQRLMLEFCQEDDTLWFELYPEKAARIRPAMTEEAMGHPEFNYVKVSRPVPGPHGKGRYFPKDFFRIPEEILPFVDGFQVTETGVVQMGFKKKDRHQVETLAQKHGLAGSGEFHNFIPFRRENY